MKGCIYFIGAVLKEGQSGAVKIGYSAKDPKGRLKALQTGHPDKLHMIGWIPGTMSDEHALHQRFRKYWLRGEWFRYEGAVHDFVWTTVLEMTDA